jgi:prepilin-type N-terminal cleavage/methylation domain-containing protein
MNKRMIGEITTVESPELSVEFSTHDSRSGFTLIELLVVMAIIVILIALSIPAIQKTRSLVERAQCQNNLSQIAKALRIYEANNGTLPPVMAAAVKPPFVGKVPPYFYAWSVLASLNPYLDQAPIYNRMDLDKPMFTLPSLMISTENQFAVQQMVPIFLCPSDRKTAVAGGNGVPTFGPTNYAACTGTGTTNGGGPYGNPWNADGMFRAAVPTRVTTEVTDGMSNTVAFSESLLGDGPTNVNGEAPGGPQRVYANVGMLTPAACADPASWNSDKPRGYSWATGEIRCASYNHFLTPNSPLYDCVSNLLTPGPQQYTAVGFKAARSNHVGGVNVVMGDASVRFISDHISPQAWTALATRAGNDIAGD